MQVCFMKDFVLYAEFFIKQKEVGSFGVGTSLTQERALSVEKDPLKKE